MISITISTIKYKARVVPRRTVSWRKIFEDPSYQQLFITELKTSVDADTDYDTFNEKIVAAGKKVATVVEEKIKGWFELYSWSSDH